MKKINKVKIGGHEVEVKYYPTREISGLMGESWNAYNIVRLCYEFPESQQEETFLHEIIHHVMSNLGYKYDKDNEKAIHSEQTVEALAESLYQVMKDNNIVFNGKVEE